MPYTAQQIADAEHKLGLSRLNRYMMQLLFEQSKALTQCSMQLQFTIQEAGVMVSCNDKSVSLEFKILKASL